MTSSITANNANAETKLGQNEVGWIFVHEYYTFLGKEPGRLHCFYTKKSALIHGFEGEPVTPCHGQPEIHKKILELDFEDCKVLVSNVDSQASADNGIIIQVLGEMSNRGGPSHKFAQTFFLAEQPNGFYVRNDIFRYLKEEVESNYGEGEIGIVESEPQILKEAAIQATLDKDEPVAQDVPDQEQAEYTAPIVATSVSVTPEPDVDQPSPSAEEPPVEEPAAQVNGHEELVDQEQQEESKDTAQAPQAQRMSFAMAAKGKQAAAAAADAAAAAAAAATTTTTTTTTKTPQPQQKPAEQKSLRSESRKTDESLSIFVRGIKDHMTDVDLKNAFTEFGEVTSVDIVYQKQWAFLDFTTAEACQKAIQLHEVSVGSNTVIVEERRKTNQRNSSDRGRGGYGRNRDFTHQQQSPRDVQGTGQPARRGRGTERKNSTRGGGADKPMVPK